ncbi:MAG: hypothetical protein Faunusvirus31_2 [Faunusvirus sp.]|uniref:MYND-type domain-containing protein n=1 Tax=Faunusvirus sp. TaxID=2487766 RepID=A0A3G4ZXK0_9VIRU|nr:MAG: hypothetical protein Faunusvirus31_2 [Faunusvirus sp.]
MIDAINHLQLDEHNMADTRDCFYDTKSQILYQIIYNTTRDITGKAQNPAPPQQHNNLVSLLLQDNTVVSGTAILCGFKIPIDKTTAINESVDIYSLYKIIIGKFMHIGTKITHTDVFTEFTYNNSLELKDDKSVALDKFDSVTVKKYGFEITAYIDKKDMSTMINTVATKIFNKKIYGDVFVTSMNESSFYDDINIDDIRRMSKLSTCQTISPVADIAKEDEVEKDGNGVVIVKNKYRYLYNKTHNYKPECAQCHKTDVKFGVCKNCLTTIYCGVECQKNAWDDHKIICLDL